MASANKGEPRAILVVDDEPEMRRTVMRFLAGSYLEYEALEADNGAAALRLLSPRVALVICDVNMPTLDGLEFTRTVRTDPAYAAYATLPVILLTARDSEDDLEQSWDAGSTLHVTKPFDVAKLDRAMKSVLGH
ncbi:MAG TPA: response regulator [Myxococcota bacterium]|jgi:CheY-like chemotaxis protein|nr:response regulator [Myxococcota bacterium]